MANKLDYIVFLLRKEFNPFLIRVKGIEITISLKKRLKINLSVLEEEVLINPKNGLYFLYRKKADNALMINSIERIKNILLKEQINHTVLQILGSSKK